MARKKAKALPPKMITVYAEILQETDDAILVRCDEDADGVWLPKSQIGYDGERGDESVEIEIPDWLADEKGFYDGMGEPGPTGIGEVITRMAAAMQPQNPETVTLNGSVMNYDDVEDDTAEEIVFAITVEDEDGEEVETRYLIPLECVLSKTLDENDLDTVTVTYAYALEQGIVQPAEDTEQAKDTPAAKRAFGENVKWIKEEKITVSTPLSEAEKAKYAEEMAALDKEIEELEDERSAVSSRLKKQIDAKEAERREMSAHVNDGELRTFSCDCLKDYATGEMVWTEMRPPYAEVNRRKMTKEEMQPSLLEYSEKIDATSAPEGEGLDFDALGDGAAEEDATPSRTCETCIHYDFTNLSCEGPWDDECSKDKLNPAYMARWEPLAEPEKACASCAHLDFAADDNACEGCGDELANFTPLDHPQAQEAPATIGGAQ